MATVSRVLIKREPIPGREEAIVPGVFLGRLMIVGLVFGLATGCSAEEAVPIDPDGPPLVSDSIGSDSTGSDPTGSSGRSVQPVPPPDVTHSMNPTPQMEQLAREQCLDDPTRSEGFVRAVDPDSGEVFAEFSIDCDEVRGG